MNTPKDIALALAITATIADAAKEHKDYLRDELAQMFTTLGADSTRAELDGERVAKVSLIQPADKPLVVDERAFIKWVAENYPHEIIETVRESFKRALFDNAITAADGSAVTKDGEVIEGVKFRKASPYVSTRFEKQGREAILARLRSGELSLDLTNTPELEV